MTISEFMQSQPDDEMIHVGSGSSFFFIGTPVEWFENAYEINEMVYKKFASNLESRRGHILSVTRNLLKETFNISEKDELIKELNHRIASYFRHLVYFQNWKEVYYREVKEFYPRKQKDGIGVIIEGIENGDYWSRDEINEDWVKEEHE